MQLRFRSVVLPLFLLAPFLTPLAQAEIGVSVTVDQPGFYGRIDLGGAPRPELIYERSVIVEHIHAKEVQRPIYLHVPPGHAKNWKKHCREYQACARPVYFVRQEWYENVYVPAKHRHHEHDDHDDKHSGKGHGKNKKD